MSLENSNKLQCLINHIFPMPSEIGTKFEIIIRNNN